MEMGVLSGKAALIKNLGFACFMPLCEVATLCLGAFLMGSSREFVVYAHWPPIKFLDSLLSSWKHD